MHCDQSFHSLSHNGRVDRWEHGNQAPEILGAGPVGADNPLVNIALVNGHGLVRTSRHCHCTHTVSGTAVIGEVRSSKVYRSSSSLHHASTAIC